jgi:hypothetical protein
MDGLGREGEEPGADARPEHHARRQHDHDGNDGNDGATERDHEIHDTHVMKPTCAASHISMRLKTFLAALSLVLVAAAGAGSCVGPPVPVPGARDAGVPGTRDLDVGSLEDEAEPLFMHECRVACMGGPRAMGAWCSLLQYHPDPKVRNGCWDHVNSSKPVCIAWCAWTFVVP